MAEGAAATAVKRRRGGDGMKAASKAALVGILTLGVAAVAVVRGGERSPASDLQAGPSRPSRTLAVPRLVDVGAGKLGCARLQGRSHPRALSMKESHA